MCGGVGYKTKNLGEQELKKFYSLEIIKRIKADGRAESFFWHDNANLPIKTKEKTQLVMWGNKDKNIKLPQTGWVREESVKSGKWDYLKPELVEIPAESGYEKKTWFDFKNCTQGLLVKKNDEERVYMLTREASRQYRDETGHDREPPGAKGNFKHQILGKNKGAN